MYICVCKGISERHIRQAAEEGAESIATLRRELGVAAGCGGCAQAAEDCLARCRHDCREEGPTTAEAQWPVWSAPTLC